MICTVCATTHELLAFITDYVAKEPVERILVGLPKQMNNEASENMKRIEPFVRSLKKRLPDMPVEYVDERFTSVLAHRTMLEAGLKKKDRQNKALVDEISATIILQTYLENRRFMNFSLWILDYVFLIITASKFKTHKSWFKITTGAIKSH